MLEMGKLWALTWPQWWKRQGKADVSCKIIQTQIHFLPHGLIPSIWSQRIPEYAVANSSIIWVDLEHLFMLSANLATKQRSEIMKKKIWRAESLKSSLWKLSNVTRFGSQISTASDLRQADLNRSIFLTHSTSAEVEKEGCFFRP